MIINDLDALIKEIPLFIRLSQKQRYFIRERTSLREYHKGEIIYREGAPADAFFCVIIGRVVIFTQDNSGNETVLEYLHRGKYFGIISLLTGDAHSVTARALSDCTLLVVNKEDFSVILEKIPLLAVDLSRTLSRRLRHKDIPQKTIFESTVIAVFSLSAQAGKTVYAMNLALGLRHEAHKSVLIIDIAPAGKIHSLPSKLGIEGDVKVLPNIAAYTQGSINECILKTRDAIDLLCLSYVCEDTGFVKRFIDMSSILINQYHYIILDLPCVLDSALLNILNQSDMINILTSPEPADIERTHGLMERLKGDMHFNESNLRVVINEYKDSGLTFSQQADGLGCHIYATLPKIEAVASEKFVLDAPASEYARAIRRISRHIGERLVGLALGVGVGYGFCHIGVLEVIEEEKIPIDVISGSSVGALIAGLWAIGKSAREILEITGEFKEPKHIFNIVDLTFPWIGFIKGNKLYNFIKRHIGNKTFCDVKLPLRIVASDIRRKEAMIFDKGPLVDAIMASCSMPGVFLPFKKEALLDGGLIQPLPTEVLFNMGVKKIIAVNVTPTREDIMRQYEKLKEDGHSNAVSAKKRKWFDLFGSLRDQFRTNILDIIFTSVELMQSELVVRESKLADVVLHPDTSGLFWLELHKSKEFARRGREEAQSSLGRIWKVVND